MKQFLWSNLVIGENSLYEYLKENTFRRTAFVISPHLKNDPYFNQILDEIFETRDYEIVLEVQRETTQADINSVIDFVRKYGPDGIIAIGGGSVLDASKLLKIFYELEDITWDDAANYYQMKKFSGKTTLIAVPTTTGTGSEMTGCAMFVDDHNQKGMFLENQIIPDVAVLDYRLVAMIPRNTLIYSTLDALTHALEASTTDMTDLVTQFLGVQSVVNILNHLRESVVNQESNDELLVSSLFAGIAINNGGVGLAHSLNYPGEDFNLPHGLITGMLTPYCLMIGSPHPIYDRILGQLGVQIENQNSAQTLSTYLLSYYEAIGMPTCLSQINIDEADYFAKVDGYVSRFMEFDAPYSMAHQKPTAVELTDLYNKLYYGRKED